MSSQSNVSHQNVPPSESLSMKHHVVRLKSWSTASRRSPETLPWALNMSHIKNKTTAQDPSNDVRFEAIDQLFGLEPSHAQDWPGILAMFNRLEINFEVLLRDEFNVIWKILGREKPTAARECWHWCLAVLQKFQSFQTNENVSMENVYKSLIKDQPLDITAPEKDHTVLAIFAVLCWTSMTLVPILEPEQTTLTETSTFVAFRVKGLKALEPSHTSLDSTARRPIMKLFGILRGSVKDSEIVGAMGAAADMDTIHESSINFFSLHTIGRVQINWVEDLTSHLVFDQQSRTLSVFCLPTFCVSNILRTQEVRIIQQVSSELFPSVRYADHDIQDNLSLHREVLLTYRLLFGQSSRSRALVSKLLEQRELSSEDTDPFLSTICTASTTRSRFLRRSTNPQLPGYLFPVTILDMNKCLIESDTYSARGDFPNFGTRLLAVQQYNLRQQPSRVRDLWRDRRNPLQWYTFWAVLWVGGITIVLGVLQLATAIIQAYYSAP